MERTGGSDSRTATRRRRLLAALASAGVSTVAGCGGTAEDGSTDATDDPPSATATATTATTTSPEETTPTADPTGEGPSTAITDLSVTPTAVGQFRSATLSVRVRNDGDAEFGGALDVRAAGEQVAAPGVVVPAGETAETTVEVTSGYVGEQSLDVALVAAGETVARASTTLAVEPYPRHDVGVDGTSLVCGDGPVRFGGASLANAFARENNRPSEASLEPAFDTLAALGASSARIFGFAPAWADMSSMPGPETYNDAWFRYFDRVVVAAKRRDIRLFVPLINGNPAYGPIGEDDLTVNVPQFVRWADDAETRSDFFDSEECMAMFEGWVERLLTHENHLTGVEYRNDPTIAVWELGNEIQMSPPRVGESIRPWIERAGAFVKGLDDRTLLTTGSYGHQGRNAFVDEASADPIDVVSIHYYPGPAHYDLPEADVLPTLESTIETVHGEIGKPLYVGEYNWGVLPEDTAPYEERAAWVDRLQTVLVDHDVAATNYWTIADEERPTSYHKAATAYAPDESTTLDVVAAHAREMRERSDSSCV